ncbi:MAG: DNA repair protein RecO [Thermoleophilia bacterium]|nr:DNA repair protein RecO [Thermoleophilia bacterium]
MPPNYSTEAIVLGSHKLRDADRVVNLFTAERGKVPTVVKGVRKVKSRFGGRLEPFTYLQVQLHEGRNLHTLTGADTIKTHAVIRERPSTLQAGLAFIDMLNRVTHDFEKRPRSFNLLVRFLNEMDEATAGCIALTLAAELKLLLLSGFLPHLETCASCGADENLPRFSAQVGGTLCENCKGESFQVNDRTLTTMRFLLEKPLAEVTGTEIDENAARETWRCVREVCRYHLGTDLRVEPW